MSLNPTEIDRRLFAMLHHRAHQIGPGDSIAEPLVPASIFHLPDDPEPDRVYGRVANPTVQAAEARLALLEDARTHLFSSGMAAYSATILATIKSGDTVLVLGDGYYAVRHMLAEIFSAYNVEMVTCPAAQIMDAALDGVRLAILETPTNPNLDVIDLAAFARRCQKADCLLAVDNTVCTALTQQPLDLGADIVISSDTKAAAGHSDLLLGHVSSRDDDLMDRVHRARTLAGAIPGAFDAWLLVRGLETLDIRLERMAANAGRVAALLKDHASVVSVRYPGLADDPAFALAGQQMSSPGFLIGVTFADAGRASRFVETSGVFIPTTSFGGLHSSADRRARWGDDVPDGFLRLSLGCEPSAPLLQSVEKGLAALS
ncbi:MAG: cystathionine gamma-lyase [Alphaproteobacteria bacterium]|nr:cystathionine gamma-lyase [Alphaproteobacteria bacterium]